MCKPKDKKKPPYEANHTKVFFLLNQPFLDRYSLSASDWYLTNMTQNSTPARAKAQPSPV